MEWSEIKWDDKGLVSAIFQDAESGEVLVLAYLDREALQKCLDTGFVHVYRRRHGKVMMKGEISGRRQQIREILLDCDGDALVFKIEQIGGAACHEGFRSCFFRRLQDGKWQTIAERVFDPKEVYGKS